jgi:hypothetical protein
MRNSLFLAQLVFLFTVALSVWGVVELWVGYKRFEANVNDLQFILDVWKLAPFVNATVRDGVTRGGLGEGQEACFGLCRSSTEGKPARRTGKR